MKRIHTILLVASTLFFFACQQEEKLAGEETGYLRLSISEDVSTNSRADVPENYDAEKIGVQILNAEGEVQESLEPWEIGTEKQVELPVGTYTLKASSAGWDGQAAGFDIPYYTGSKDVTITAGAELNETITCTLANVKVSTVLYPELLEKVSNVTVKVYDDSETYSVLFSKTTQDAAYFPVVDALYADITITTDKGTNTLEKQQLCNAEGTINARDHYILNIKPQDSGNSQISVEVDPTTHEYSFTFGMSTKPSESVTLSAGAWDRLAYLQATDIVTGTGVSMEGIKFQYREKTATATQAESEVEETWNDVVTTSEANNKYTAMLTGLTASTEYEYRLINSEDVAIGNIQTFFTKARDTQTSLVNGGFESWSEDGDGIVYPGSNISSLYWDTSNKGANTASWLTGVTNPTNKVTSPIVSGSFAAQLKSASVMGFFAAASLYTGNFGEVNVPNATLNFGQAFTSCPIALHGYYQYTPQKVQGDKLPDDATVSIGGDDQCAIYIALAKKTYEINNGDTDTFIDFENDNNIIAYGTIEGDYITTSEAANGYTEFTIPLQYKESLFGEVPTHIIVVCSASKYGDYMTGGVGSTLYVDEFSLVYEGTPDIWKGK